MATFENDIDRLTEFRNINHDLWLNFLEEKYPSFKDFKCRKCNRCGEGFDEGFCIDGGLEYFCSEKCLNEAYTKQKNALDKSIAKGNPNWELLFPNWQKGKERVSSRFEYEVPIEWYFNNFRIEVMDFLMRHADFNAKVRGEDVRIVFWFDN